MARHAIRNPLLLPELFHHILDYIDVSNPVEIGKEHRICVHEPSRAAQEALFALAQTCRAISEPSLDHLWRALGSLVPLIRCFAQVADVDRAKTPPSPAEWAIIHRYAVRVRELCITGAPESTLSLYFVQCTSSPPLCLLPNLRVLVWNPSPPSPSFAPLIEQLLVPGLVALNISLEGENDSPHRLFECYAVLCPNLRALRWNFDPSVYHHEPILHAMHALSDSLLRLRKIDSLKLFAPLDPIPLKHVILSPDYKVLGIMLDHLEMQQVNITSADTPFPNVETIKLEIWDLDFLTSFLRPHRQMFRTLVFKLHSEGVRPLVQSILSCFTALATPQRIDLVQSIDFRLDLEDSLDAEVQVLEDAPMSCCITYETLSPLASFRCLRKLVIMLCNQISIDDDELATLARSWPSLEILRLDCRSGGWPWASAKYVTLRGLLALIAGCPKLCRLCLPMDARIVPMDTSPDIRNTAIECIELPDSPISEPRLVADLFRKHLPHVKYVDTTWPQLRGGDVVYMQECERMWSEVEILL